MIDCYIIAIIVEYVYWVIIGCLCIKYMIEKYYLSIFACLMICRFSDEK